MALPVVKLAVDCSDFTNTVLPYTYQLKALPQTVFESILDPAALRQIYLDTNPLIFAFAFTLFISSIFLIVSEFNKNYSQVDRAWSILPTIYNAHYTLYAHMLGLETKRLDMLLTTTALWSCRLTFNYWRKGGYSIGSEDYRWEVLRKQMSPPLFFLFNVTFISLGQSLLLFAITSPTYIILLASRISADPPTATAPLLAWSNEDFITCYIMAGLILVAAAADQQQWWFQEAKKSYQATAKVPAGHKQSDLDRGFVVTGLWSYSRHPNFAAEQAFWIALYQWSCFVSGSLYNWSGVGALGYLALFQGSTWFTELISGGKYPEYKEYQARVGKFLPRFNAEPPNWDAPPKKQVKGGADGEEERLKTKSRQKYDLR